MTLQDLRMLHAYSSWATNTLFESLASMPAEQISRDMKSSHGSILGTLIHLVAAEKMWLSRWRGTPDRTMISAKDVPTLADLRSLWETVGRDIALFLGTMNDRSLQETITVSTPRGEQYTHTYAQTFLHLMDHSTYHRGQIITLLRQLGLKPPATNMIFFLRQSAGR